MEQWLQQWLARPETQAMIARGLSTGTLTFQELDAALPASEFDMNKVAAVAELLLDRGITFIEADEPEGPPPG